MHAHRSVVWGGRDACICVLFLQWRGHIRVYATSCVTSSASVAFRTAVSGAATQTVAIATASARAMHNVLLQGLIVGQCARVVSRGAVADQFGGADTGVHP